MSWQKNEAGASQWNRCAQGHADDAEVADQEKAEALSNAGLDQP